MNERLQNIVAIIRKNESLTAEQKDAILKSLGEVDKELEITLFKLDRTEKVKKTTAILLEETIEELEQKRKAVEVQNRELEIEAALERVRAVAMAMKDPNDMLDVCHTISDQLMLLKVGDVRNVQTVIIYESRGIYMNYEYYTRHNKRLVTEVDYLLHPAQSELVQQMQKGPEAFFSESFSGEEVQKWFEYQKTTTQFLDSYLATANSINWYFYSVGPIALGVSTYAPLTEEEILLFKRFRNVFELAYRRYLDIEKALAQAREAKIEVALERVRARAMSMQTSDELKQLIGTVFTELTNLDIVLIGCVIIIFDPETNASRWWMVNAEAASEPLSFFIKYHQHTPYLQFVKAWKERSLKWEYRLEGSVKKEWDEFLFNETELAFVPSEVKAGMQGLDQVLLSTSFNNFGCLNIGTVHPLTDEQFDILLRFAKVFDLTYTRFNDLKQAEAQAREAQIQLALERVRARTMAMQRSDELSETAAVLFQQFKELGEDPLQIAIGTFNEAEGTVEVRITDWGDSGSRVNSSFILSLEEPALISKEFKAWKEHKSSIVIDLTGKELENWINYRNKIYGIPVRAEDTEGRRVVSCAFFSRGTLSISTPESPSQETIQLLERFAYVFNLTYNRFLDLQKAESQAREAKIELGLERVRAKAMAMQNSDELSDLVAILFEELTKLDMVLTRCIIWIFDYDSLAAKVWMANSEDKRTASSYNIKYLDHPYYRAIIKGWKERSQTWVYDLKGSEKKSIDRLLLNETELSLLPDAVKSGILNSKQTIVSGSFNNFGLIEASGPVALSGEQLEILSRFAKVFDLTYTRFNDLKKAEAQAREGKIEAALERVRAKAMAMHTSKDLTETIKMFYLQMKLLVGTPQRCGVSLFDKETHNSEFTSMYTTEEGESVEITAQLKMTGHPMLESIFKNWLLQKEYHPVLRGNEIKDYYQFIQPHVLYPDHQDDMVQYGYYFFFKEGTVYAWTREDLHEDVLQIYRRFTSVISLTYKRYNDLKLAEAQAREAQIELGLERVRARAMAMQDSGELNSLVGTVFTELTKLNLVLTRSVIIIYEPETNAGRWWMANSEAPSQPMNFLVKYHDLPFFNAYLKGWKERNLKWVFELHGKDKIKVDDYLFTETELSLLPGFVIEGMKAPDRVWLSACFNNFGCLTLASLEPLPDEHFDILIRFAKVFDLTYTRFNDLKQAEAQAREAQIEAALERVRAAAMAMHKSDDLHGAVKIMFEEFQKLNLDVLRCGVGILNNNSRTGTVWATSVSGNGLSVQISANESFETHPLMMRIYEFWQKQEDLDYVLQGQDLVAYYRAMDESEFELPESQLRSLEEELNTQYYYCAMFKAGGLYAFREKTFTTEDIKLMKRFANVLNLTYNRFLDLQKAESQAREAKIEASLERVRSKAMAMHSSQDLADTIVAFYHELETFSITPRRCGVGLINKETRITELSTMNTTEEGQSIEIIGKIKLFGHKVLEGIFDHWLKQEEYHPVLQGSEIKEYYQLLKPQIEFPDYPHDATQYGYFFFFPEGGVYAWTDKRMAEEEVIIYRRFTSVLSLTYKRYKDLQQAEELAIQAEKDLVTLKQEKKKTEDALSELKATQAQLIQSEKMASLGELTAGIAHEIQNPLNFINNFSEVNKELLAEMTEEIKNGNFNEVKSLAKHIEDNQEKINHHGKRADTIVKGMLQHSRSSSGIKEQTGINKLADEYLRLAYHGLRAKDKSFNTTLETDYDDRIGNINIIPQDMGRAILNLITNALYAVAEKKKQQQGNYEPIVSISTKKTGNIVLISVKDNGNGIPQKVLDKIFQPFFTTKPTGQGTGLGLSLSYDIVKAHGGELKVKTKAAEGSEFIIQLPVTNN